VTYSCGINTQAVLLIEKESLMASSRRVEALEKETREKGIEVDDLSQRFTQLKLQHVHEVAEAHSLHENLKSEILFLKVIFYNWPSLGKKSGILFLP
jgi:hypothetical protein